MLHSRGQAKGFNHTVHGDFAGLSTTPNAYQEGRLQLHLPSVQWCAWASVRECELACLGLLSSSVRHVLSVD